MAPFDEFFQSIQSDGKSFEHFVKWFLLHDPEWVTQVDQVWLWEEWPDRWGPDCGIDLIFCHKNGQTWAVQAKCYDPSRTITKKDADTFLSESNRSEIDKRLLIASTDLVSVNAKRTFKYQEKPVVFFGHRDFQQANVRYPAAISDLQLATQRPKPEPRQHQLEAIAAVTKGFGDHDCGQMIMACGTGKTFTTLWVKEALKAQSTLVLVPSLNLLSQTMREWVWATEEPFEVLNVCSDKSVGRTSEDMSVSDAPFPVTSDVSEIGTFLKKPASKVVFCTYQSSDLIAQAQTDSSVPSFDLTVADEAHRCAGKSDAGFATVLDGQKIRSYKRLFTTATPRFFGKSVRDAAKARDVQILSMDDPEVFGPELHRLTFGEAIERDLLSNYQVVIVGVDEPMVAEWIDQGELLQLDPDTPTDARSLASKIALIKAIKDYDLQRVISFHSRVNAAKLFSEEVSDLVSFIHKADRPTGSIWSDYVSGAMPTGERTRRIGKLKGLEADQRGILTNARCLSEGVDVPALDGIAFIDPRGSQIDIIQAVGRAIRRSENKEVGTIVLPVFIEAGDSPEDQIEQSVFKPVWDVLKALRAHDEVLADELDTYRTEMGRKGANRSEGKPEKVVFDLPQSVDPSFSEALQTVLVEQTTQSWEFWYGLLQQFVEQAGHANPPAAYTTLNGLKLGQWVRKQRPKKLNLSLSRREKLERLSGWVWDARKANWFKGFDELRTYAEEFGHLMVPATFVTKNGFKLGSWVNSQRTYMKQGKLESRRVEILESLSGWTWDVKASRWTTSLKELKAFVNAHGHALVPLGFRTSSGFPLGGWVSSQRSRPEQLSNEEREALESVSGWAWNALDSRWEIGFEHLCHFINANGHSRVPRDYVDSDGYALGNWCKHQRTKMSDLSPEKRSRLERLPNWVWSWDRYELQWQEGYQHLLNFCSEYGTARVPHRYIAPNGFKLSNWVVTQRSYKKAGKLNKERQDLLQKLDGWVWSVR